MHWHHRRPLLLAVLLLAASCARGSGDEPRAPLSDSPSSPGPGATAAAPATDSALVVTERGLGALRAGMTLAEASAAFGGTLVARDSTDPTTCQYLEWRGGPPGVMVMMDGGRIARVDVDSATVPTAAGARVGDSEGRVLALYRGRVTVSPHRYVEGHYLTVTPEAPADSSLRIVFETDLRRVTRYRAGTMPQVSWVEGCS